MSPVLLAGLALRPLPPRLLQPVVDHVLRHVLDRHPDLLERLDGIAVRRFLVDVTDLPFAFVLDVDAPRLTLVRRAAGEAAGTGARIAAPLLTLLDLMQGRLDGDALFFSRDLVIEGETEAVVALRNAVDGAGIDLVEEMLSALGPLGRPLQALLARGEAVFRAATSDLETLRTAAIAPALRQQEADARRIAELERKVAELSRRRQGEKAA